MAELKFLNLSRGRLRASVTTKYNSLETLVQGKNCAELKALLVSVKELGSKIEVSNEKIGILSCEDKISMLKSSSANAMNIRRNLSIFAHLLKEQCKI